MTRFGIMAMLLLIGCNREPNYDPDRVCIHMISIESSLDGVLCHDNMVKMKKLRPVEYNLLAECILKSNSVEMFSGCTKFAFQVVDINTKK